MSMWAGTEACQQGQETQGKTYLLLAAGEPVLAKEDGTVEPASTACEVVAEAILSDANGQAGAVVGVLTKPFAMGD